MTLLSEYYVPGLHIEDRSIKVPLDWTGHEPGHGFDGESISLFYRVVTAPEHVHDDLPLLVFLQGGPGGSGPRPLGTSSDGWIEEAMKHFQTANRMDPNNMEYTAALNQMMWQRQNARPAGGYRTYTYGGNPGCSSCDLCTSLICADCCCECMGGDLIRCC